MTTATTIPCGVRVDRIRDGEREKHRDLGTGHDGPATAPALKLRRSLGLLVLPLPPSSPPISLLFRPSLSDFPSLCNALSPPPRIALPFPRGFSRSFSRAPARGRVVLANLENPLPPCVSQPLSLSLSAVRCVTYAHRLPRRFNALHRSLEIYSPPLVHIVIVPLLPFHSIRALVFLLSLHFPFGRPQNSALSTPSFSRLLVTPFSLLSILSPIPPNSLATALSLSLSLPHRLRFSIGDSHVAF